MKRISFLSLVTILFCSSRFPPLIWQKPQTLRRSSVPSRMTATGPGQPTGVSPCRLMFLGGTQWLNFKLKTDFQIGSCSGTVEYTVFGPGTITSDAFSRSRQHLLLRRSIHLTEHCQRQLLFCQ